MPKITFIDSVGEERVIDAVVGESVMQAATQNSVPEITAECGGACSCATCHVYINSDWMGRVGKLEEFEDDMLDIVDERKENSRLACQIEVSIDLDGLIVTTQESEF